MKLSIIAKSLLPGVALLLATSAFAANKGNKGSIRAICTRNCQRTSAGSRTIQTYLGRKQAPALS